MSHPCQHALTALAGTIAALAKTAFLDNGTPLPHHRPVMRPLVTAVHSAPAGVGKTRFAMNLAAALAREAHEEVLFLDYAIDSAVAARDRFGAGQSWPTVTLGKTSTLQTAAQRAARHEEGFQLLRVTAESAAPGDGGAIPPLLQALARRFRLIVVDLDAYEEIVIARGRLRDGARASGSMPGVFPPPPPSSTDGA